MLGQGPTDDINITIGTTEKKFTISFNKAKKRFCVMAMIVICFLMEKKPISLKVIIKM